MCIRKLGETTCLQQLVAKQYTNRDDRRVTYMHNGQPSVEYTSLTDDGSLCTDCAVDATAVTKIIYQPVSGACLVYGDNHVVDGFHRLCGGALWFRDELQKSRGNYSVKCVCGSTVFEIHYTADYETTAVCPTCHRWGVVHDG